MEILSFPTRTLRGHTKYVGCGFCSRTFRTISEKNAHILSHFEQEMCLKCDQNLVRIGDLLYVIHGTLTCIDSTVKEETTIEESNESSLDYDEPVDGDFQAENDCDIDDAKVEDNQTMKKDECGATDISALHLSLSENKSNESSFQILAYDIEKESTQCASEIIGKTAIKKQGESRVAKKRKNNQQSKVMQKDTLYKRYICDICQKSFRYLEKIRRHMNIHGAKAERFTCKLCGRSNLTKSSMERSHFRPKFACSLCENRFCIKQGLKRHSIDVHYGGMDPKKINPIKYVKRFKCKIDGCNELLSESNRSNHMATKHDQGPFECEICKKQTKKRADIKYHILAVHVPSGKKFQCKLCGKSFLTKSMLRVHNKRSHIKALEYMCSECGAAFVQVGQLKIHMTKHTGEKPYPCTYDGCKKAFRTNTRRTEHMRSHTGEKPYDCPVDGCDRRFAYKIDEKRHKFNAHGIYFKKFPCQICSDIFPENMLLKKHMKKHGIQT